VSLINGIGGLGAGLTSFAGAALQDQLAQTPTRQPLLSAPPPSAPEAPEAAPEPAARTTVNAPAAYLPLWQEASKRTGIPIDILIAQAKQESGFNPDVVSSTGGIGLHQVQPSTARDPGFGLQPVDPATLKDPAVNIAFASAYLAAKAGPNVDWNDPRSVDVALAKYNGGGDPRYVQNVRRYLGTA
jgi:soluble lytic murein transglycosylase-like protein